MTPQKEPAAGGGTGEGAEGQLKKGPWTKAEDAILKDYVKTHGKGNWNSVQRNTGLQRCGKSCRLRWANHLRPDLKKGPFSRDEEMLIIRLHAEHGNKWARIASHPELSGRTDNGIKNYWNTRKKRQPRACYALGIQQQMAQRDNKQVPAAPAKSNLAPAPATPDLMEGNPYFSTSVAVEEGHFPLFNSSAQLLSPNPFGSLHQNPSRGRISFHSELSSFPPPASYLFHNFPSVPQYGLGSFEPSPPPPSYSVKMELPSSQLFSVSRDGNTGLCDPLLQSPYGIGDLPKDALPLASVPFAPYSSPAPHAAYWAMEPLCTLDGSDFSIGIQMKKEMAEKMNQDVFTLPSLIPVQTMAPVVPQADWGLFDWHDPSDLCGEFSNNPSSAVTDDDTGVEMPDLQRDSYQ